VVTCPNPSVTANHLTTVVASLESRTGIVNKARSDFLFATPSFIYGAARVLDLFGVYDAYNSSSTACEADYRAIWSDWSMVGQDIYSAMKQFEHSLPPGSVVRNEELSQQMSFFP